MIKINLLNSVTERQGSAVMAVDRKVGSAGIASAPLDARRRFPARSRHRLGCDQHTDGEG